MGMGTDMRVFCSPVEIPQYWENGAEHISPVTLLGYQVQVDLHRDPEAPELFAVWLDDDILGSGADADEALDNAIAQLDAWDRNTWSSN